MKSSLNVFSVFLWLVLCFRFKGDAMTCDDDAFACGSGDKCIPKIWKCDSEHDCMDGSDEVHCGSMNSSCNQMQFQCSSGRCLHKNWRCDGEKDCRDGSDEANCEKQEKCAAEMVRCDNGKCLSPAYLCDGDDDCGDRSDEKNCSRTCSPLHFQCVSDSRCILKTWRCDGDRDCADGSDEKNCPTSQKKTCKQAQFSCGNGRCVPSHFVCDGDKDCEDERDEKNCGKTTCPSKSFTCSDGKCILPGWRCDGENDCLDGRDEKNCTTDKSCPKDHFMCENSTYHSCIKIEKVCDGVMDCPDASDESKCSSANKTTECKLYDSVGCNGTECNTRKTMCESCYALWSTSSGKKQVIKQGCWVKCNSGDECIGQKVRTKYSKNWTFCCCKGNNCNDIANPVNYTKCPGIRCEDGTCISAKALCDGHKDCLKGVDEMSCEKDCLMTLEVKSSSSPQDSYSLKALKSFNVFLNNSVSAWCARKQRPGKWVTLDLGTIRTVLGLTTSGYPVATEPGYANFTLQISGENKAFLNYTENGKTKVFPGNRNPLQKIKHILNQHIKARYIRIFPMVLSNENFACLRVAVLGCDKPIVPMVKVNTKLVAPKIGEDGNIYCSVRSQRGYAVNRTWYIKQKSGIFEPLSSGHNHIITEKQLELGTKFGLFAQKEVHLRLKYNFDFIKELFNCELDKINDTYVCSLEYKCVAKYTHVVPHSAATASIKYNFGKRIKALRLSATNVTEKRATLSWQVYPEPKYDLSLKGILLTTVGNGAQMRLIHNLDSSPLTLRALSAYQRYRLQLIIPPATLPGVANTIRSNEVIFTTLATNPQEMPSVDTIDVGSNYAILHCKPPPKEKRNGPIDGYVLRKARIRYGGMAIGWDAEHVVLNGEEIVRLNDLKPLSKYIIRVAAYNLRNGRKFKSKETRITIMTLAQKPTLVPKDVKAQFELPNSVEVTWTLPSNEPHLNFTGFQIRVNEITSKSKRQKRALNTHSRVIEVGEKVRSRKIDLSSNTEFCMIEVAMSSQAGVGPFSKPITVKVKKVTPTAKTTTAKEGNALPSKTVVVTKVSSMPETKSLQKDSRRTQKEKESASPTKGPGTKGPGTQDPSANRLDSKARGLKTEVKKSFFIEFIVAVAAAGCLVIIVIIIAYKMCKRKGDWKKENGYSCETRNMEPFLLDSEDGNWNNEAVSVDSLEYSRSGMKSKTEMSGF